MQTYSIEAAKADLSALAHLAAKGQEVLLTENSKPLARIVALDEAEAFRRDMQALEGFAKGMRPFERERRRGARMNVPDSSAWIEYFRGSPLKATFRPIVQDLTTLIVPSIVIYEVHKWMLLDVGEDAALTAKAMMLRGKVIVLDPELATAASRISIKHKLTMADAIIYATTLAHNADLWTTDGHFKGLPNVRFFEKE